MTSPVRSQDTSPPRHSTAFVLVVAGFITSLLVANIIAVKLIDVWGWILPASSSSR